MKATKTIKKTAKKSRLVESAEQALAFLRGADNGTRVTTYEFAEGNVKDIRKRLNLTQEQFANEFGFSRATVRNWEQGRHKPDTPTRILLAVIRQHPDIVRDVAGQVSK